MRCFALAVCLGLLAGCAQMGPAEPPPAGHDWRNYAGDKGSTRYSPLAQIDRDNIAKLRVLWERPSTDPSILEEYPELSPPRDFNSTPILVDGVLYTSNGIGLLEALDPGTGETLWIQEPLYEGLRGMAGRSTRGVAYWTDGSTRRIFSLRGDQLVSTDARTGKLDRAFGDDGRIPLSRGDYRPPFPLSAGPLVVRDLVIVAGGSGDDFSPIESPTEDVRAFDVRTGELRWTFHVMPRPGEFGYDTWEDGSADQAGAMGAWAPLSADEELGYLYLPLSSPMNAFYGGLRPGQNLFANSLVCVDVRTGERVWHYQLVHHDLWDYDLPASPILGDVVVDGKPTKIVAQITKHGFLFVFDRVTGKPVWPIEERPVPASTVPGEKAWPTQPFPTKPPPFSQQGVTVDDLVDFTAELRAEALEIVRPYRLGPLFTPPSGTVSDGSRGTATLPGVNGGGNVNGGAFDPETGVLYVPSYVNTWINDLIESPEEMNPKTPYMHGPEPLSHDSSCCRQNELYGPDGIPLVKPPYGRITALDLNTGELAWMVANGDGPRDHPRLRDLDLPPLGVPGRPSPLVTKTLLFIGEGDEIQPTSPDGGGGRMFRAYDKATGEVLWETELAAGTTGAPMSYLHEGKQYVLVAIGSADHAGGWVALGLP